MLSGEVHSVELYTLFQKHQGGPVLGRAWMRETESPYRTGRGVRLRIGRYSLQVGVCGHAGSELGALQGRELEATPEEIREWQG